MKPDFQSGTGAPIGLSGDNISENIDKGVGVEQDLFVNYQHEFENKLALSAALFYYFYPAADEKVAGVSVPSYLEPNVGIGYVGVVDLWLNLYYFAALQDELGDISYFYVNPHIGKKFDFGEMVGLNVSFGLGFKVFENEDTEDNAVDILFTLGMPIWATDFLYIEPSFNVAWTNLEKIVVPDADPALTPDRRDSGAVALTRDEAVVWVGLNVGVEL